MSAKFLHTIADENPELQRQIGCMTGIFQMFDRQHLLPGKRLNGHHNLKKLSSGHALSSRSSIGADRNGCTPPIALERSLSKSANDNRRISVESSRTSFSSSSCLSFSSVDCNKSAQEDHPSMGRTFCTERSSAKGSTRLKNHDADAKLIPADCRSLDSRNVIKDSMCKDAHALSVRTSLKEDTKSHELKHRDSPRPVQLSKSMDASRTPWADGKSKVHADLGESLRVLVKLKQAPRYFSEINEPPRRSYEAKDASLYPASKEAPRFSYDGRDLRPSLDSRESSKFSSKLREFPRLSLDGRESSLRSSDFYSRPNTAVKEFDPSTTSRRSHMALEHQQELGSGKRPPGVVAKLMGLETMPSFSQDQTVLKDTSYKFISQKKKDTSFSSKAITSAQGRKDPVTPQHKRPDSVVKSVSNPRVPIEPAPWRHQNKIHLPQSTTFGFREPQVKRQSESVYSEIGKRLKDIEFQQSNKDLRALKYILDAMHAKGLLETGKGEDQHSRASFHSTAPGSGQNLGSIDAQNTTASHATTLEGSKTPRSFDSPIVIMKPARSLNRLVMPPSSVIPLESLPGLQRLRARDPIDKNKASVNAKLQKDQTPKAVYGEPKCQQLLSADSKCRKEENSTQKNHTKMSQVSPRPQAAAREDDGSSVKSSNSVSPRLQHRKVGKEKRSNSPRPSSQSSNMPPRQPSNRSSSSESVSPRVRLRRKPAQAEQNDDQLSETSSGTRSLNHQSDEASSRSDGNIISVSQVDTEVTSSNRSADLCFSRRSNQIPSGRAAKNASSAKNQKKKSHMPKEDVSAPTPEQPSPISLLDASFCPARVSSDASKDTEIQDSINCSSQTGDAPSPNLYSGFNQKKLANIEDLVQKLSQLSSKDDEAPATDHIALLCETQSPDHRYVSEILLASGLLMIDLPSRPMSIPIQLHPSGHPINPDLFLVLEQTQSVRLPKPGTVKDDTDQPKPNPEKLHRKLVFDVVNELLIQKLKLASSAPMPDLLLRVGKARFPGGQHLLKELCADIERLKAESLAASNWGSDDDSSMACERMLRQSEIWFNSGTELQTLVLDMERSIFRDLIDEVITGEGGAFGFQAKPSRRQTANC